ncbi:MAG: radical SAM protein [Candidatus Brocadiaceae bacterium]|jgi:radical SAM superfamily enzyme YgiQ (UPF0313 family)
MKIALIEPRSPDYHVYSHLAFPRLGLPILATILRDHGHDVRVYVEDLEGIGTAEAWDILSSDLVGISCTSATAPRGYAMARLLKLKGVPVAFGGVHPTFMPEEPLKHGDYVIKGEAEVAFPRLVDVLENGGDLSSVPNLYYTEEDQVRTTEAQRLPLSLDDIPIPDFSLLRGVENMKIVPLMTTRGCPHGCTFCCVSPMFGCRYRMKSTERVIEELRRVGESYVFFCDDNFTASPSRTKELLAAMLREKVVPPRWYAQVRADVYRDTEMLDLMRRTNCRRVFVGFESVNQDTLNGFHKHQTLSDIESCVEGFHRHGIPVHGMFMFGADQDGSSVFERTVRFALDHRLDTVQFLILTPVPGSELFRTLDDQGRIFTYDWSLYDGHHVVFEPARMKPLELQIGALRANRRFYSFSSVLRSLSCFRFGTAMLRYVGRCVVRGWRRTNARFMQTLRDWQRGRRNFPRHFSLGKQKLDLPPDVGPG